MRSFTIKQFFRLIIALISFNQIDAQPDKQNSSEEIGVRNTINMCPFGIVFGIYSMNYEYLITPNHGLVARIDYESVPQKYSDANLNVDGRAVILNYRYHFSGKMESIYLGAYGRYRIYEGDGSSESTKFNFDISEFTIGLNVGKKWIWDSGFNINFALGYGYSFKNKDISTSTTATEDAVKVFEKKYDFIDPFLGELSIGYAF